MAANSPPSVFIAGAGGIGTAVALILLCQPGIAVESQLPINVILGDKEPGKAQSEVEEIRKRAFYTNQLTAIDIPVADAMKHFKGVIGPGDVVLDCTPGKYAPDYADLALNNQCHYANLTEHVRETEIIIDNVNSSGTEQGFILQTGLAPGFINVLANSLFKRACSEWGVKQVDYVSMKVGALSENAFPPHYYGFTWSEVGVATEYIKAAYVIRDSKPTTRQSFSERGKIVLNGRIYEEDLTSGGAADLPVALTGRTKNLDYKTLRHVGHYDWVEGILKTNPEIAGRADLLELTMKKYVPRVENDFVIVYASVQGHDRFGQLQLIEKFHQVKPRNIGAKEDKAGYRLRAIQTTTAAPLAQCAIMLLKDAGKKYKGVVLQSQLDCKEFLEGKLVSHIYED